MRHRRCYSCDSTGVFVVLWWEISGGCSSFTWEEVREDKVFSMDVSSSSDDAQGGKITSYMLQCVAWQWSRFRWQEYYWVYLTRTFDGLKLNTGQCQEIWRRMFTHGRKGCPQVWGCFGSWFQGGIEGWIKKILVKAKKLSSSLIARQAIIFGRDPVQSSTVCIRLYGPVPAADCKPEWEVKCCYTTNRRHVPKWTIKSRQIYWHWAFSKDRVLSKKWM